MSKTPCSHARQFGHGARQALAIHCTLAHSGAWRGVGQVLADHVTLTCLDLPGHGKSAHWDAQTDFHHHCTKAALSYLARPFDVIGHSFGATIALRLAVEHPELVRSLTLIEPVFFAAAIKGAPDRMSAYRGLEESYSAAFECGDHALAARQFNRFWGDGTKWDEISETTRRYMTDRIALVPAQGPMVMEDNAGLLAPGRLGRASMPCLLIEGDQSPDIIDAINTSLANRLPNATRAVIAGAGHMSPITHPGPVGAQIMSLFEMA